MKHASFLVLALCLSTGFAKEIPTVKPSEVGMSAEKLKKVDRKVEELVKQRRLAGAVVIVARKGKIVHFKAYGQQDIERKKPMKKDTIVRIYSMSKAIASAATMMLVDQKKLDLDAPVAKYLPELKNLKVYAKSGSQQPKRPMTARDLLRHTAGLTYGLFGSTEVDKQYRAANLLGSENLAQMTKKLGRLPLLYSPGTDWVYSVSIDVLGRLVEVISGETFDVFLKKHIFDPLDMKDTAFSVPKSKLDRFAANYNTNNRGKLTLIDDPVKSRYAKKVTFFSGGGGLVSTARDYMRFLLMIQNGGELYGKRLLSKKAVKLMTTNQLPKGVKWVKFGTASRTGVGFGLGFSVFTQKSKWDPLGRVGEYGWGGAASTHFWTSPKDQLSVVTLEQTMPYSFLTEFAVKGLIYDAIEK